MKLIKVRGIVVKEVVYGDNDKIITLLTDKLGLISCIAKGAKRTKSALLASSQYLVYSEFVLFKGTTFYHINSAEVISTFYNIKTDMDKLDKAFSMTKAIVTLVTEDMDSSEILKLFLNSIYFIQENNKNIIEIVNIFRIKLIKYLGFSPQVLKCNLCGLDMKELKTTEIYYDYVSNIFVCGNCNRSKTSRQIKLTYPCYLYIRYVMQIELKQAFSLSIKEEMLDSLDSFGQALIDCICKSV